MKKFFTIAIIAFSLNAFAQDISDYPVDNSFADRDSKSLTVSAVAEPESVCFGQQVHLFSVPEGGSTNYTYVWSSVPSGFVSDAAAPVAIPKETTVYTVSVFDGINYTTASVTVTVKQLPTINLIPGDDPEIRIISENEISTCVFHTVKLDAGNSGGAYLWNSGSEEQSIIASTSGISVDSQEHMVTVTDPNTGCSNEAGIKINFTFSDCTFGIDESKDLNLSVYPNPSSNGMFNISLNGTSKDVKVEVYSFTGMLIDRFTVANSNGATNRTILNLKGKSQGIYFLKVITDVTSTTQKLVIGD